MSSSYRWIFTAFCLLTWNLPMLAQSFAFGIKGGPSLGLQKWNNIQGNDPLFAYHVLGFIETVDENSTGSLYAESGYHVKGRAIRYRSFVNPNTGIAYDPQTLKLKFNNLSLSVGARNRFPVGDLLGFYSFALRSEYNLSTDLELYQGYEEGVNKFLFGLSIGGGFEFPFSEFVGGILDIRFSPDISRQIFIPASRYNNPFTGTEEIIGEQSIKNVTLEVSLGVKFLRKVIYVD